MRLKLTKAPALILQWVRRFWPDLLIGAVLALIVGWTSYRISGKTATKLLEVDIWGNADTKRVFSDMSDPLADHYRTKVHPLFVLLTQPIVMVLKGATGLSMIQAARLLIAIFAGIWTSLIFCLFRKQGCRRSDASLFAILGAVSASAVFWLGIFETYALGSISIVVALLAVEWVPKTKRPEIWMALASAFTLSVTITNWMAGLLAIAVSFPPKRALQVTANAFCIVVILWTVEKFAYPTSQFFLGDREETLYMNTAASRGPIQSITDLTFHSVVMPTVPRTDPVVFPHPCLTTQSAPLVSGSPLQLISRMLWLLLFGIGIWALFTQKDRLKLRIALGGTLLGQLALHAIYGPEVFLYSLHVLPLLLAVAALGSRTRFRPAVLIITLALILMVVANNYSQLSNSIKYLREQHDVFQKHSALQSGSLRIDDSGINSTKTFNRQP